MNLILGGGRLMPGPAEGGSLSLGRLHTELLADLLPLFKYKFHIRISKMEWRGHWTSLLLLLLCLFLLAAHLFE